MAKTANKMASDDTIGMFFTVVSIARSYVLRRLFEFFDRRRSSTDSTHP